MAEITIAWDPAKLAALFAKLGAAVAKTTLRPPMTRGLAVLQADLATYPPPSGRPNPPRSERQRRFLMALARQGGIPYRRTGDLGRSWTSEIAESPTGLVGTLGNAVTSRTTGVHYGPFVQGEGTQVAYHMATWATEQQVLNRHSDWLEGEFAAAVEAALG